MKKKILGLLLAVILLIGTMGCGNPFKPDSVSEDTLEWYVDVNRFVDYENTRVDKVILEKTGVKIKFIIGGNEASSSALAGMINSDSLPDIVTMEKGSNIYKEAIAVNQLYAYEDLFNQYGVENFIPEKMSKWNNIGGKNYGVISHFSAGSTYTPYASNVLIARKDILEACDIDPISGFSSISAMKASLLKAKQYNSSRTFIPFFSLNGGQILHEFLAIPKEDAAGNYVDWKDTDAAKQLICDMQDFYDNGLITNESLANTMSEEDAILSKRVFCMTAVWAEVWARLEKCYKEGEVWVPVGPLKNDNGDDPILSPWTQSGWLATSISKNCKNPEAALKLINFLYSDEGQRLTYYGIEGETYSVGADGKFSYTTEYLTASDETIQQDYGTGWTNVLLQNTDYIEKMRAKSTNPAEKLVYDMRDYFSQYTYDTMAFEEIHPTDGTLFNQSVQANNAFAWGALIQQKDITTSNIKQVYADMLNNINNSYNYGPVSKQGTVMAYYNQKFQERKRELGISHAWPTLK